MSAPASPLPKVAVITGAAGGLGMALITKLLASEWSVVAGYHTRPPAIEDHPRLWPLPLDVTSKCAVLETFELIETKWGHIDLLVNNAGVALDNLAWQISDEAWSRTLEVNLKGAMRCTQAVLSGMVKRRSGHVINISSYAAKAGPRGQSAYAASKAGLIGLTQSFAREYGKKNLQANAVFPGAMPTGMTASLTSGQISHFTEDNMLRRMNDPAEVADFICFLAKMKNVSGQVFQLDSRITAWT